MTIEELRERCKVWQGRLRLSDWDVTVEIKRARDMQNDDCAGEVERILNVRRAWIVLRDLVDTRSECQDENDLEITLVHELIHLYTEPLDLPSTGLKHTAEEQMIDALARALVALDREGKV